MLEKLPAIQRFLAFISSNRDALLLFLLFSSIAGNVYLIKLLLEEQNKNRIQLEESIKYERERGKSFEDIIKETAKNRQKSIENEQ